MPHVLSGLNPGGYGILNIDKRLLGSLPVTHAAGKIGHGCKEPAAVFKWQWFNQNCIGEPTHGKFLTESAKATSCLMYTTFIGRLKGTVNFAATPGWAIL